ncbi:hypothetical protein [Rufibacter ruber]|uniref:hypothetical protein n=1 Tax=Rufibacter ruber TaxID=1783499 RepID=UPI000831A276|nr:hypothetical protein [Rufibacter ruber]
MAKDISRQQLVNLSELVDTVNEIGKVEPHKIREFIDIHFQNKRVKNPTVMTDLRNVEQLKKGLDLLHDQIGEEITALRKRLMDRDITLHPDVKLAVKYKLSKVAEILDVSRATVTNWTNSKAGGYLRSFEVEGCARFVIEEDLVAKYRELKGEELRIDNVFREKHQYFTNL